jgi:hypothetical protein
LHVGYRTSFTEKIFPNEAPDVLHRSRADTRPWFHSPLLIARWAHD